MTHRPAASVSNAFNFDPISMASCNPPNISWVYSPALGQSITELSLTITNNGVPQLTATESASASIHAFFRRDDPITLTITPAFIDPALREFTWTNVSVPPGMYIIQAEFPIQNSIFVSPSFFVANGCNGGTTSSARPSSSSGKSSLSSRSASLSSIFSSTSPPSTPTFNPDRSPSSRKMNGGAIAGGITCGLVNILVSAYVWFHRSGATRRRAFTRTAGQRSRRWGGLGSGDSLQLPMQDQGVGGSPFRDLIRSSYTTMSTLESAASTLPSTEAPTPSAAFPSGTSLDIYNLRGWEPYYNLVDPECIAVHLARTGNEEESL
ncbi:hypothetical protein FB45DRAFT_876205 [Roridomyces roridus]|uniref:Uncharacterized protein n=1 Tax=Roridomyces roridus TaxID=1738132 RepID=A0AAD7B4D9_9AGAR|nr:hypothetical protein FB45DRAFT_876205 [Roridomyces roridus]